MNEIRGAAFWNVYAHDRLLDLLPDWEPKRQALIDQQKNRKAGLAGEKRVLEVLRSIDLPQGSVVFWDVSLPLFPGVWIQFDILILSCFGLLILEVKQIAGRLRFVSNPAALQKIENNLVTLTMGCPAAQFGDQRAGLETWLRMRSFHIPVHGSVVFTTNPIIEDIPRGLPIISLRELRMYIRDYLRGNPAFTIDELKRLIHAFESSRSRFLPYPLCSNYNIDHSKVPLGPRCNCGQQLVKDTEKVWVCNRCNLRSKVSYRKVLLDWFLLRSKTITVSQCAALFGIHRQSAWRILNQLPLEKHGNGRQTFYEIDYEDFDGLALLLNG